MRAPASIIFSPGRGPPPHTPVIISVVMALVTWGGRFIGQDTDDSRRHRHREADVPREAPRPPPTPGRPDEIAPRRPSDNPKNAPTTATGRPHPGIQDGRTDRLCIVKCCELVWVECCVVCRWRACAVMWRGRGSVARDILAHDHDEKPKAVSERTGSGRMPRNANED